MIFPCKNVSVLEAHDNRFGRLIIFDLSKISFIKRTDTIFFRLRKVKDQFEHDN